MIQFSINAETAKHRRMVKLQISTSTLNSRVKDILDFLFFDTIIILYKCNFISS